MCSSNRDYIKNKIIEKGVCIRHLKLIHYDNMKISKIISIVLILITIVTTFSIFQNTSKAATYIIAEADLYSKGEIVCFKYGDITVGVEYIVYMKDGVEYPAYCLNRDLPGVTEKEEYTVKVEQIVNNNKIWRAVTNGYPFKTKEELNCYSNIEAFAATKMAVYDAMYNYDWDDFTALDARGERILAAAEKISKAARASTATKPVSIVNVKTDDTKWNMDSINKEYASKTFYVTTNVQSNEYNVKLNNVEIQNVKVTDLNNAEKTTFKTGEKFKVLIPISEMTKAGNFEIEVTADMKTMPILYGKSPDSSKQSYALAAGDYEFENSVLKVNYLENTTKIEIKKYDAETKAQLTKAKFNILDANKQIIYSDVTTGENGIAVVEHILPGKYYIEEVKSPDGYTIYDEPIEIDLELNQKYTVNINNYKEPENEEKQVEDEDTTVTGRKEINLPRTGF